MAPHWSFTEAFRSGLHEAVKVTGGASVVADACAVPDDPEVHAALAGAVAPIDPSNPNITDTSTHLVIGSEGRHALEVSAAVSAMVNVCDLQASTAVALICVAST